MNDPEEFEAEEICDLCGGYSVDCTLIDDGGQLVCLRCMLEALGQLRLEGVLNG